MLRRYLIVNGVSTIALYAAIWAFVPSYNSVTGALSQAWQTYATEHTVLGPVLNRIFVVGASVFGLN